MNVIIIQPLESNGILLESNRTLHKGTISFFFPVQNKWPASYKKNRFGGKISRSAATFQDWLQNFRVSDHNSASVAIFQGQLQSFKVCCKIPRSAKEIRVGCKISRSAAKFQGIDLTIFRLYFFRENFHGRYLHIASC